jgi:hypothetical protein
VARVRRPDGEVLDMKECGKYRENRETVVLPRHSGGQVESGGEAMEDDAVDGDQNHSLEFLLRVGCVGRGRLLEPARNQGPNLVSTLRGGKRR